MDKLLLSALSAMSTVTPAMAQNGTDGASGHGHLSLEHDDFAEQLLHRRNADASTGFSKEDRRGKNAAGLGRHGRRASDFHD